MSSFYFSFRLVLIHLLQTYKANIAPKTSASYGIIVDAKPDNHTNNPLIAAPMAHPQMASPTIFPTKPSAKHKYIVRIIATGKKTSLNAKELKSGCQKNANNKAAITKGRRETQATINLLFFMVDKVLLSFDARDSTVCLEFR